MGVRPSPMGGASGVSANPADLLTQLQNNPQVAGMLGSMGIQLPDHLRQNMLFPDPGTPGFFGQHPNLSRGLENAFMAVGNMGPTSESAGENISNVARSVLSVPMQRREYQMSQVMAPFQIAQQMGELDKVRSESELNRLKGSFFQSRGNYYDNYKENHPTLNSIVGSPKVTADGRLALTHKDGTVEFQGKPGTFAQAQHGPLFDRLWQAAQTGDPDAADALESFIDKKGELGQAMGFGSAMGRISGEQNSGGYLNPVQQATIASSRDSNHEAIGAIHTRMQMEQQNLEQMQKSPIIAGQNAPPEIRKQGGKAVTAWVQQQITTHQKNIDDMTKEINGRAQAESAFPAAYQANPNLGFDQFRQGFMAGPQAGPQQPQAAPAGGFDWNSAPKAQ